MKKFFLGLTILTVALISSSCTKTYYQVCTTKPVDASQFAAKTDPYIYEDENIKIVYNMWRKYGDREFSVYNKTDKYLYSDGYNSCLTSTILGSEGEIVVGETTHNGIIPPHTWRLIRTEEPISDDVFLIEGLKEKVRHSESMSFTRDETPLVFANYFNYYYWEDGNAIHKTVILSFYIDRITNYSLKDYLKMKEKYYKVNYLLDNGKVSKKKKNLKELPINQKGFYNIYYK